MNGAITIISKLQKHGFDALLVGGCVRDKVLNTTPKDYDIVTSALPDQVEELFQHTLPIGKAYGVILVDNLYEVTTFRKDVDSTTVDFLSGQLDHILLEDAHRRDLTINAIYYDPISDKLYDPVGGISHLQNQPTVQFIGSMEDRIQEDPIRLLRAYRFILKYNAQNLPHLVDYGYLLASVSKERVFSELTKCLIHMTSWNYSVFQDLVHVLHYVSPILVVQPTIQSPVWHPEGDVLKHTFGTLKNLRTVTEVTVMAAYLHDIGKSTCTQIVNNKITAKGHEHQSAIDADKALRQLKCSNKFIDEVVYIVKNHMRIKHVKEMKRSKVIALMNHEYFETLKEVSCADSMSASGKLDWWHFLNEFDLPNKEESARIVTGQDLIATGFTAGPQFKDLLDEAYSLQHDSDLDKMEILLELQRRHLCTV